MQTPEELKEHGDFRTFGTHMMEIRDTRAGGSGKIPLKFYKPCLKMVEALKFESDEDSPDDCVDGLVSPLEELKHLNENYSMPNNLTKEQLSLSINDLVGRTDEEDIAQMLKSQVGSLKEEEL